MRKHLSPGLLLSACMFGVIVFMAFGLPLVPAGLHGLVAIAAFVLLFAVLLIYWRGIDEAAREAQKSAWLWGGTVGMMVAVVPAIFAAQPFALWAGFRLLIERGSPEAHAFLAGVLYVVLAQVAGFLLVWAVWWLRASAPGKGGAR